MNASDLQPHELFTAQSDESLERGGRPHELVLSMPDLLDADTWSAAGPPNQTAAKRFLRSSRG